MLSWYVVLAHRVDIECPGGLMTYIHMCRRVIDQLHVSVQSRVFRGVTNNHISFETCYLGNNSFLSSDYSDTWRHKQEATEEEASEMNRVRASHRVKPWLHPVNHMNNACTTGICTENRKWSSLRMEWRTGSWLWEYVNVSFWNFRCQVVDLNHPRGWHSLRSRAWFGRFSEDCQ